MLPDMIIQNVLILVWACHSVGAKGKSHKGVEYFAPKSPGNFNEAKTECNRQHGELALYAFGRAMNVRPDNNKLKDWVRSEKLCPGDYWVAEKTPKKHSRRRSNAPRGVHGGKCPLLFVQAYNQPNCFDRGYSECDRVLRYICQRKKGSRKRTKRSGKKHKKSPKKTPKGAKKHKRSPTNIPAPNGQEHVEAKKTMVSTFYSRDKPRGPPSANSCLPYDSKTFVKARSSVECALLCSGSHTCDYMVYSRTDRSKPGSCWLHYTGEGCSQDRICFNDTTKVVWGKWLNDNGPFAPHHEWLNV